MPIVYHENTDHVDWNAMRQVLIQDDFHNGRSPEQYRLSFERSAAVVIACDGTAIVGTARMLSDGICNAYIVDVWTQRAYRRQGIAREMLRRLEARATGQHISLWTDSAPDFYAACGYRQSADTLFEKVVGQWLQRDSG